VDDRSEVRPEWLIGVNTVSITAGASAPENLVEELLAFLQIEHGFGEMVEMEIKEEDVRFTLPNELSEGAMRLHTISNAIPVGAKG